MQEKFGLDKTNIKKEQNCGSPKELGTVHSLNRRIYQIMFCSIFSCYSIYSLMP